MEIQPEVFGIMCELWNNGTRIYIEEGTFTQEKITFSRLINSITNSNETFEVFVNHKGIFLWFNVCLEIWKSLNRATFAYSVIKIAGDAGKRIFRLPAKRLYERYINPMRGIETEGWNASVHASYVWERVLKKKSRKIVRVTKTERSGYRASRGNEHMFMSPGCLSSCPEPGNLFSPVNHVKIWFVDGFYSGKLLRMLRTKFENQREERRWRCSYLRKRDLRV